MILIDKSLQTQKLIVSVSHNVTVNNPVYTLGITSDYSNDEWTINITGNTSTATTRYDEFKVPTSAFTMSSGMYIYTINEVQTGKVEKGIMKIFDQIQTPEQEVANNWSFIIPNQNDDDFIVYQGN